MTTLFLNTILLTLEFPKEASLLQPSTTYTPHFADDTGIIASDTNPETASFLLQTHLNQLQGWFLKWRIKINELKSSHITFALRPRDCPPIYINNRQIPTEPTVKYLGMHLDRRLTWTTHIKTKRKLLNHRLHQLRPLLKSNLPIQKKILIYKLLLNPIATYGIHFWGTAKNSNLKNLQAFQSISLRIITNAPWYVSNLTLHNDLNISPISDQASKLYKRFHKKLHHHPNPLIANLSTIELPDTTRRLKRKWSRDLLS